MSAHPDERPREITALLSAWNQGDERAFDELARLIGSKFWRRAEALLRDVPQGQTLQTDALVQEAYVRLLGADIQWQNRKHFFAVAARALRQILVDHARRRKSRKRNGARIRVSLSQVDEAAPEPEPDVLALNEALTELAQRDPRAAHVVELRYFGGLTIPETAKVLGISVTTVKEDWIYAKLWLYRRLSRRQ